MDVRTMTVKLVWLTTHGDRNEAEVDVEADSPQAAASAAYTQHLVGMYMYDPDPRATAVVDGHAFELDPYTRVHVLPAKLDGEGYADPDSPVIPGYCCPCDECSRGVGDYTWDSAPRQVKHQRPVEPG